MFFDAGGCALGALQVTALEDQILGLGLGSTRVTIQRLAEESDAFVVVHGGLGTLTELALVWNMLLAGELPAKPLMVMGAEWPRVIDVVRAETQMGASALRLLTLVETPEAAVERLPALLAVIDR